MTLIRSVLLVGSGRYRGSEKEWKGYYNHVDLKFCRVFRRCQDFRRVSDCDAGWMAPGLNHGEISRTTQTEDGVTRGFKLYLVGLDGIEALLCLRSRLRGSGGKQGTCRL